MRTVTCSWSWVRRGSTPTMPMRRYTARDAGIEWMVCVGTGLETSQQAIDLAARYDDVYATVGLHPHDASQLDEAWDGLVTLADAERCVAIGEAGFDLHYEHSPRAEQEVAFRRHIQLAKRLNRPLMIHSRNAWDDTFRLLDEEGVPERTIFHCFTGGPEEARPRSIVIATSRSAGSCRSRPPTTSAPRPRSRPPTGCWSRPTARTSRPCRTGGSRTSPRSSRWSAPRSPRRAALT